MSGERIKVENFDGTIRDLSYGKTDGADHSGTSHSPGYQMQDNLDQQPYPDKLRDENSRRKWILDINPVSMHVFGGTGREAFM